VDGADWLAGVPRGPALPASVSGSGMGRGLPADAATGGTSGRCQDAPLWLCSQVVSLAAGSLPHTAPKECLCRALQGCRLQIPNGGARKPSNTECRAAARRLEHMGSGAEEARRADARLLLPAKSGALRAALAAVTAAARPPGPTSAPGPSPNPGPAPSAAPRKAGRREHGLADAARREALKISAYMLAHHAPRGSMLGADRQYSELPTAAPGDAPDAGGAPGARPAAPPQPRGARRGACCCFCC